MKHIYGFLWGLSFVLLIFEARSQGNLFLRPFSLGFNHPTCIVNAGDDRLFIVEQQGTIRITDSLGNVMQQPFLDITARVKSTGTEQGLLGLVFHPQYNSNGYFYVDYIGAGDSTHISRFNVSNQKADSAIAASEKNIMTIYQPYINHNGGELQFGPDGYLYIGLGDGGSEGDPDNRAQDTLQLLGKILRIDINTGDPYSVPTTNPFVGHPAARGEIWAMGLRNPWRFSFDRSTGNLWIGDVGQNKFEEIDFQPAGDAGGENYGWRCYEGDSVYNIIGCFSSGHYIFPIFTYSHVVTDPCESVTGGYVYRGSRYPVMEGRYYFADYCADDIWSVRNISGSWVTSHEGRFGTDNFSTFGEDVHGELYIAGRTSGNIFQLADTSNLEAGNLHSFEIRIRPNPFSGSIMVDIPENDPSGTLFIVLDIRGRAFYSTKSVNKTTLLDLGYLDPGMYFLSIQKKGQILYKKLVKTSSR